MSEENDSIPRILISGSRSQVGKFVLTVGLIHELRRKGLSVSCSVIGPNLLQAVVFRRITGRYVRTLDRNVLTRDQSLLALSQSTVGADIQLILGSRGLFDGELGSGSLQGADAEYAAVSGTPVLLVVDSSGFGPSIGAVVKGFETLSKEFAFAGALLNRFDNEGEITKRRDDIGDFFEASGLELPLGFVPPIELDSEPPPRRVSQSVNYTSLSRKFFVSTAELIREHVNLDRIIEAGKQARPLPSNLQTEQRFSRRVKIAVSEDSCFGLLFQDNLELLRFYGAELVPFSPLADRSLPKSIGGVYITGAYLDEYGRELSENDSMRRALRDFADSGGVLYAEAAGAAYMCSEYEVGEEREVYSGVGLLKGRAVRQKEEHRYLEGVTIEESILGQPGTHLKGMSVSDWRFSESSPTMRTLRYEDPTVPERAEGFSPGAQIFCTFAFQHFGSNSAIARNLVDAAEVVHKL